MSSLNIENYDPGVEVAGGLNTDLPVDFSGAATVLLPAGTTINGSSLTALGTITSSSAQALAVGLNGLTNPAFNVDASTALQADGVNVKGLAAGNGAGVKVITSGTNAPLTIDAAGSGTITIAGTSTGAVTITPATTITGALTQTGLATFTNGIAIASAKKITGAGTGANGIIIDNPKNTTALTMSGTARTVEIAIGGTPYYFLVYPTAS